MKRKKIVLSVCACMCLVLSGIVMAIAFSYTAPKHKHILSEEKTYHICNDYVYYTRKCVDGCEVAFNTKMTFKDAIVTLTENEKIILDENVTLTEEVYVQAFAGTGDNVQDLELNINLDLNGFTLSTNIANIENNSLFMFNANRGQVNFNIKNGKIYTRNLSYIFRFKNNQYHNGNIVVNIDNLECETSGIQTTPIFGSECYNIEFNATNSKFISTTKSVNDGDYGVGAFINSDSEFNFTNCEFRGGDAIYVKSGVVNLTGCKLVNVGLVEHTIQNTKTFSAVGACLAADCYATNSGISLFEITIVNCQMESTASFKMIYVIETTASDQIDLGVNSNSIIDVKSCVFNNNPTANTIPQYDIVKYPNGEAPANNGTQVWVCGSFDNTDE